MNIAKCPDCNDRGITFRGVGKNSEYMICARWQEPGHPPKEKIEQAYREHIRANMPRSRRFA